VPSPPRTLRRALLGFLTPPTCLSGEVPEHRRPGRRTVSRRVSAERAPRRLGLLSYNLQRAVRELQVIRTLTRCAAEHTPDVVLLQEAPRDLWNHPGLEPVFAGCNLFYAPFHQVERPREECPGSIPGNRHRAGEFGQVIATRLALDRCEVIELPTVTRAGLGRGHLLKRIALSVEIPIEDGRTLRLVNVHFEPFVWPRGRGPQQAELLRALPHDEGCVDLCVGDFNAAFGVRREPGLVPWWRVGFEAALPRGRRLDNALARGHRSLEAIRLDGRGSDHRPLWIRAEL
jgi:endonuclease/exonuclease/phosphatase family metal-dependent hydrolase